MDVGEILLIKYSDWLAEFKMGKTEVATIERPDPTYAVHSMKRYLEGGHHLWETAITYTGRLVVRSGMIGPDGVTVTWGDWTTEHEVEFPKS